MSAITPGAVRVRAAAPDGHIFASALDASVDVQQADGSWLPMRGVYSATVTIEPGSIVSAALHVELAMIEFVAPPECVAEVPHTVYGEDRCRVDGE